MNIIDISTGILTEKPSGFDPQPRLQALSRMDDGGTTDRTALYCSLHAGTHITVQSCVLEPDENPKTVSDYPVSTFVGPAVVVDLPEGPVTGEVVECYFPRLARRILLRSRGPLTFFGGAADDIAALGYTLIGLEGHGGGSPEAVSVRRALLNGGAVLLEGLDLSAVRHSGEYYLYAAPLKLDGTEAAPARAVLLENS